MEGLNISFFTITLDSYFRTAIGITPTLPVTFSGSYTSVYSLSSISHPLLVSTLILNILPQIKQINRLNLDNL